MRLSELSSGLLMLICGDVIRPGLAWMLTRTHRYLASTMAQIRDPDGFARLRQLAAAGPASARMDAQIAATRIATLLACKGGRIDEITVGDCVELVDTQRRVQARGGQKKVDFYLRLRALGIFPARRAGHHPRLRARRWAAEHRGAGGPLPAALHAGARPDRGLPAGAATRRWTSPASMRPAAPWPGCSGPRSKPWRRASTPSASHRRSPASGRKTWRPRSAPSPRRTGERVEVTSPRLNAKDELLRVRAFYLDIAQWAVEEPARWGPWAVPCPISDAEIGRAKERQHRKSRMDQRTRERLPVLPVLVRTANERRRAAARRLHAAADTPPGALIPDTDGTLRRASWPPTRSTAAASGRRTPSPAGGAT